MYNISWSISFETVDRKRFLKKVDSPRLVAWILIYQYHHGYPVAGMLKKSASSRLFSRVRRSPGRGRWGERGVGARAWGAPARRRAARGAPARPASRPPAPTASARRRSPPCSPCTGRWRGTERCIWRRSIPSSRCIPPSGWHTGIWWKGIIGSHYLVNLYKVRTLFTEIALLAPNMVFSKTFLTRWLNKY